MADEKTTDKAQAQRSGPAASDEKAKVQSPATQDTEKARQGEPVAEAPKPDDEGKLPGDLSGRDLDIARNTGVRTGGTTQAAADQYAQLGVNPRLDNRLGTGRPQGQGFAPKPQQFPGPEVGHFEEHKEQFGTEFDELFGGANDEPRGMQSLGPHGRGEDDEFATRIAGTEQD
jgi:hypothetical protein